MNSFKRKDAESQRHEEQQKNLFASSRPSVSAFIAKARDLAAAGQIAEAGHVLESAVKSTPDSPELLSHLGFYYYKIGRFELALNTFAQREKLSEPDIGICRILAEIHEFRRDYSALRQQLFKARQLGDSSTRINLQIFLSYIKAFFYLIKHKSLSVLKHIKPFVNFTKYVLNWLSLGFIRAWELSTQNKTSFRLSDFLLFYHRFDSAFPREMFAYHKNREAQIASHHLPIYNKKALLLDIGTGKNTLPVFWATQGASIFSMDGSLYGFNHIKSAGLKLKRSDGNSTVYFIAGNALQLPFSSNVFDGISALCALEHIPGRGDIECMCEIHRVLKPGGKAVITVETNNVDTEQWMEVPYEIGYQTDGLSSNMKQKNWQEVFCRNYSPKTMISRLAQSQSWNVLEYGFYDDRFLPLRKWLDQNHPLLSKCLSPFQLMLALLNYRKQSDGEGLSPSSIGYLVLEKKNCVKLS